MQGGPFLGNPETGSISFSMVCVFQYGPGSVFIQIFLKGGVKMGVKATWVEGLSVKLFNSGVVGAFFELWRGLTLFL